MKTGLLKRSLLVGNNAYIPIGDRGLFAGGTTNSNVLVSTIDYVSIATTGNAINFGNLTVARGDMAGCASSTRGLFMGGYTKPGYVEGNIIDYITFTTTGNATDFGDLTLNIAYCAGFNSSTRGMRTAGYGPGGTTNSLDYVTIASTGNATDFGDLTVARYICAGASSPTRGLTMTGYSSGIDSTIDYVTIATAGNATDFGDANIPGYYVDGGGNDARAMYGPRQSGSFSFSRTIEYVTIATTGNSTSFGNFFNLTTVYGTSACSSPTRVVWAGGGSGTEGGGYINMGYVTIATTGDVVTFGDLTQAFSGLTGTSNSNGGL